MSLIFFRFLRAIHLNHEQKKSAKQSSNDKKQQKKVAQVAFIVTENEIHHDTSFKTSFFMLGINPEQKIIFSYGYYILRFFIFILVVVLDPKKPPQMSHNSAIMAYFSRSF